MICTNYNLPRTFVFKRTEKHSTGKIYVDDITASRDRVKMWMGQLKLSNSY